jgi:hypothetical protein
MGWSASKTATTCAELVGRQVELAHTRQSQYAWGGETNRALEWNRAAMELTAAQRTLMELAEGLKQADRASASPAPMPTGRWD